MTTSEPGGRKGNESHGIVKSQDEQETQQRTRIKRIGHRALNVDDMEASTAEGSWVTVSKEVKV